MDDLSMKQVASIVNPFQSSQIQYDDKYLILYSSYNSWYRSVTGESMDAQALRAVKLRDVMWAEYLRGDCLERLRPLVRRISLLTRIRPLNSSRLVGGIVDGPDDWEGLIEFWYALRCDIIHGNVTTLAAHYPVYTKLAYETLQIFMTEVVMRLRISIQNTSETYSAHVDDTPRLDEVDLYSKSHFIRRYKKIAKKTTISPSKHFTS